MKYFSIQKLITWRRIGKMLHYFLLSQCLLFSSAFSVVSARSSLWHWIVVAELGLICVYWIHWIVHNFRLVNHHLQILPVNIKGLAGSTATMANWLISWIVTMTANLLLTWSSGGLCLCFLSSWISCMLVNIMLTFFWPYTATFTIYTVVAAFTVVFTALWVPETKGRTLEEIQFSLR